MKYSFVKRSNYITGIIIDDFISNGPLFKKLFIIIIMYTFVTQIHKPTSEKECKRIEADGGSVKPGKNGVLRVVWSRPINAKFPEQSFHHVPFLAMTRALGTLFQEKYEQ